MNTWPRRIGRAFLLALIWGIAWAPLGVLTGLILDPDGTMDEPWIAIGAYPGFLSALVFSIVLGLMERSRGLAGVPLARAAAWGTLSGLLVMTIPLMSLSGTPNTEHVLWRGRFVIVAAVALLSAVSAVTSAVLARKAKQRTSR